ncbi:MAG: hypothetical protein KatS3mg087_0290 [Patescibacteria group bacterium]|nr:MAG: hypothetical protein KatS3mg087_0290 [Patescibacteria group bacterium]
MKKNRHTGLYIGMDENGEIQKDVIQIRRNIEGMRNANDILDMTDSHTELSKLDDPVREFRLQRKENFLITDSSRYDSYDYEYLTEDVGGLLGVLKTGDEEERQKYTRWVLNGYDILESALYEDESRGSAIKLLVRLSSQTDDRELRRLAIETIIDHFDEISSCEDNYYQDSVSKAVRLVATVSHAEDRELALDVLRGWLDRDLDNQREYSCADSTAKADSQENVMFLIAHGSQDQALEAYLKLIDLMNREEINRDDKTDFVTKMLKSPDKRIHMVGRIVERELLGEIGLNAHKTVREWQNGWPDKEEAARQGKDIYDVDAMNLKMIFELEEAEPGICAVLQEEFNISNFARYPKDMLLRQYRERDRTDKKYGIVIYPKSDWNSAFYDAQDGLLTLDANVRDHAIRIVECETKTDVARFLIKCRNRYGRDNKIAFGVIAGHGSPESITFGGTDTTDSRHVFTKEDLKGRGVSRITDFFDKDATLILISCSTGKTEGVGENLSQLLDLKVIAPDEPTNISAIQATKNNGHLEFQVRYSNGTTGNRYAGRQ